MTQYEYLSAGTDVVFPYTSIQAISSDNLAIGGGDPNELLVSLLNRVFTRITTLESQVSTLTTQVNTLRNQLASLQVPEITEHFTLYLYTYTANTDTYPSDAAGDDNAALFNSEGEINGEDTLNSNGWFTIAENAAAAGRDSGYETPGIWGIKLEVSKRDGKYFIYPGVEDFKYDPQLTNGDALVTTFLQKIEDVKAELVDKIDVVDGKADNAQSTIDGAVTAMTNAVNSNINTAVNDILNTKGVTTTNITKWNNFNSLKESLEAEFTGSGFVTKLETALTLRGFSAGDHDKLIAVYTKLSGITSLDTYIDNRVALGSVNMEALELAVMSDQDNAFKRALNKWKVSGLGMSATTDTMDTWKIANITLSFVRNKMGLTTGMIKAAAEWEPDPNSQQCSASEYDLYSLTPIDPCSGLPLSGN